MLVFVCALIPKAAASVLASAVNASKLWRDRYMDKETGHVADEDLTAIILGRKEEG